MDISEWWPKLNGEVRATLVADAGKSLTADEVVEIVRVRGIGPAGAYWAEHSGGIDYHLRLEEQQWIDNHREE